MPEALSQVLERGVNPKDEKVYKYGPTLLRDVWDEATKSPGGGGRRSSGGSGDDAEDEDEDQMSTLGC